MRHQEMHFQGADGLSLYSQNWLPEGAPRALIAIVHGIGEHSGRYMNLVDRLVPNHVGVWGYDLRGHGRSEGQRGHIDSWSQYRTDLLRFLEMIKAHGLGCPLFLLGHSMGALIVLDFLQKENEELAGAIISGAPIEPVGVAKPYLVAIARILSRIYPRFVIDLGLNQEALSRIPAVVEAYRQDPLVHGKVSARWGTESLAVVESVKAHVADIAIPILMIHGEADRLNSVEGARVFFEQIPISDKEFWSYPGSYHEVHNDLDSEKMLGDLLEWIDRHSRSSAAAA